VVVRQGEQTPDGDFLLFVYGTLMRDGPRARVLAGQRFLTEARTAPGYALYDLGPYPGLVRRDGAEPARGEVFAVAASLRPVLDRVEGAPLFYRLEEIRLDGVAGPVYAYLYQGDPRNLPLVQGGRWDNRRAAPWDGGEL
jgi:gamma-glutamylcyclotransferase (GGCT)/AIG2-like uncharacterized protein YtfP